MSDSERMLVIGIQAAIGATLGWFWLGKINEKQGWPRWTGVPIGIAIPVVSALIAENTNLGSVRGCAGCGPVGAPPAYRVAPGRW